MSKHSSKEDTLAPFWMETQIESSQLCKVWFSKDALTLSMTLTFTRKIFKHLNIFKHKLITRVETFRQIKVWTPDVQHNRKSLAELAFYCSFPEHQPNTLRTHPTSLYLTHLRVGIKCNFFCFWVWKHKVRNQSWSLCSQVHLEGADTKY